MTKPTTALSAAKRTANRRPKPPLMPRCPGSPTRRLAPSTAPIADLDPRPVGAVPEHSDVDEPSGTWTGLACPDQGLVIKDLTAGSFAHA